MSNRNLSTMCGGRFAIIPAHAITSPIPRGALWLFTALCAEANTQDKCTVANATLAAQAGVAVRTIQRWRWDLERLGLITVTWRKDRPNIYRVIRHPGARIGAVRAAVAAQDRRKRFAEYGKAGAAKRRSVTLEMDSGHTTQKLIFDEPQLLGGDRNDTQDTKTRNKKEEGRPDPAPKIHRRRAGDDGDKGLATRRWGEDPDQYKMRIFSAIRGSKRDDATRWHREKAEARWLDHLLSAPGGPEIFASITPAIRDRATDAEMACPGAGVVVVMAGAR